MRFKSGLSSTVMAAALVLSFTSAQADARKIPDACRAVASALKNGLDPLTNAEPLIKTIKMKEVPASDLKSILPEKDFEEIQSFPYTAIARFDYDGDRVNDLVIRLGDGGTAECEYWQIYKGVPNSKRVSYGIPPYDDWTTSDSFCKQQNEFVRIGKRVYHLIAAPSYPDAPDDGYRVFEYGHRIELCKISEHWDWKNASVTGHCEDPEVCAAVKSQAGRVAGNPGTMLTGTLMPRVECSTINEPAWYEGAWKIDIDNDGIDEYFVRLEALEIFLDARAPAWSDCGKGLPIEFEFNPEERWRFEPDRPKEPFFWREMNFIRVAGKNYLLFFETRLKTKILIVLIENGVVRQVGTVVVGPPKISVKIEGY
ncbi:MAG: hypothetical protein AB7P84_17210 [Alphaproteobacteria bacterium]